MPKMILNGNTVGGVASDASKVNYGDSTVEEKLNKMTSDVSSLNSTATQLSSNKLDKTLVNVSQAVASVTFGGWGDDTSTMILRFTMTNGTNFEMWFSSKGQISMHNDSGTIWTK